MMMFKRTMNQCVLQATLIGMLALLGGCTDKMAGLMESDKAAMEENAKPSEQHTIKTTSSGMYVGSEPPDCVTAT